MSQSKKINSVRARKPTIDPQVQPVPLIWAYSEKINCYRAYERCVKNGWMNRVAVCVN